MPNRPPKTWFDRCVDDVVASGHAADPAAVCGATWARKGPREKAATTRAEEGTVMARHHDKHHAKKRGTKRGKGRARKPTHHGGKLHGAALAAWKKAHGMGPHRSGSHRGSGRQAHRTGSHHKEPRRAAHKVHHHRCAFCGHTAKHDAGAGCLHRDRRGMFCTCKSRG
jgi:hypothetical protein